MKTRLVAIGLTVLSLLAQTQASAYPFLPKEMSGKKQGWFFNKINVSISDYNADLSYCNGLALKSHEKASDGSDGGLMLLALNGLVGSRTHNADLANCMAEKNYRVFSLPDEKLKDVFKKLNEMTDEERQQYISSQTPPEGTLISKPYNALLDEEKTTVRAAGRLQPSDPNHRRLSQRPKHSPQIKQRLSRSYHSMERPIKINIQVSYSSGMIPRRPKS